MATKGTQSEVGESSPTEKTIGNLDNLVDDVIPDHVHSSLNESEEGLEADQKPVKKKKEEEDDSDDQPESDSKDSEESDAEDDASDSDESGDDSDSENDELDDEVVPASKYKKALDKMQKRIDSLVAEREEAKLREQSEAKTQVQRLEQLSVTELNELRENVEESIMDAKVEARVDGVDVSAKLAEYKELKKNIEATAKKLPQLFAKKQAVQLSKMVETVKDIDPNVVNQRGDLWETAKRIYGRMPSLQQSETGQAEALAMAAEYYVEKKSIEGGREKVSTLSKKVSNLKKKTALDSNARKGNQQQLTSKKLRDKAVNGTYYDKLDFVGSLIPEDFI